MGDSEENVEYLFHRVVTSMGITQDPMTSIGATSLFRGLAARRNPFPDGYRIDCLSEV